MYRLFLFIFQFIFLCPKIFSHKLDHRADFSHKLDHQADFPHKLTENFRAQKYELENKYM